MRSQAVIGQYHIPFWGWRLSRCQVTNADPCLPRYGKDGVQWLAIQHAASPES